MRRFVLLAAGMLSLPGWPEARAAESPPPADIEQGIRELGAETYEGRERAETFLWKAGVAAIPALRKAATADDPEISTRARAILEKASYGIWPDTPDDVRRIIETFKEDRDPDTLRPLLKMGEPGRRSILAICESTEKEDVREAVIAMLAQRTPEAISILVEIGRPEVLARLLEQGATGGNEARIRACAEGLLLAGRLKARIAELKALSEPGPLDLRQLAYLSRADGDITNAVEYAVRAKDTALERSLRQESCDWKALAAQELTPDNIEQLGLQAAFRRLAGQKGEFETAIEAIRAAGERLGEDREIWFVLEALMVNDQWQDAFQCMIRAKRYVAAFDCLVQWGRFDEALRLVETAREEQSKDTPYLEERHAALLAEMGETGEAAKLLRRLLSEPMSEGCLRELGQHLSTPAGLGAVSNVLDAVLATLDRCESPEAQEGQTRVLLDTAFSENAMVARSWYSVLRARFPHEKPVDAFRRLQKFASRNAGTLQEFETIAAGCAITEAAQVPRDTLWHSLATAHAATGGLAQVTACERKACDVSRTANNCMRLATALAAESKWKEAAAAASEAYRIEPAPAAEWARGWALMKSGDERTGRKAMKQAEWLVLAEDERPFATTEAKRQSMMELMADWGADKESAEQGELILRVGGFMSREAHAATRRLADRAYVSGDFTAAAPLLDRSSLHVLLYQTSYTAIAHYLQLAAYCQRAKVFESLARGRTEEAVSHAGLAYDALPLSTDQTIELVIALEKASLKGAADDLFTKSFQIQADRCTRFPRYALGHNMTAWMAARLRRELPAALEHARRALELEPQCNSYRDTLAEVLFQLGRRSEAVAEMKKCLEQAPDDQYIRRQLKRMETGDPASNPV